MKIHWCLLLVALVVLVVAGQGQHFFYDEWAFVGSKLDAVPFPERYLLPHNEHWTMLPLMAYRTLGATVGVGSYWPYLGLLLLLHLGVTHVLWQLMLVTGSKPIVATALAAVFSVIGSAAEDVVWAFQIAFVGATFFGVSAVYLAVTGSASWRKTIVLACLITASVASSGVGLGYLLVVPMVLARRRRRYAVVALCLPLLVYVTWYALFGRSLTHPPVASATLPLMVVAFVTVGLVSALTAYFGFSTNNMVIWLSVGVPILAVLTLACRGWMSERTLPGRTFLAMCLGAVAFFGAAGLARGGLGLLIATSSRYVYVAIALLLPAMALVISRGADRHPHMMKAIVPVAIVMAGSNISQLLTYAAQLREENGASRQVLVAASDLVRGSGPIFADQSPEPLLAPDLTAADLRSRHLDGTFGDISPTAQDRLIASLNLQIRVTPERATSESSVCQNTLKQRITVATSPQITPTFLVSADATVAFTLHEADSGSAQRVIDLAKGTYKINSVREAGELAIESKSPGSLLANC